VTIGIGVLKLVFHFATRLLHLSTSICWFLDSHRWWIAADVSAGSRAADDYTSICWWSADCFWTAGDCFSTI